MDIENMAVWQFRALDPNENSGASTVDDNFADEQRSSTDILVRETIQNPLDARSDGHSVRVRYSVISIRSEGSPTVATLFQPDWMDHAIAGRLRDTRSIPDVVPFLIIEDFGTSGLEGRYTDSSIDGEAENWNAFWFREGEGAKRARSNGGAGQGKITLYLASTVRTVFALTVRRSDKKQLAFGCSRFRRNYKIEPLSQRWSKEARWSGTNITGGLATPVDDSKFVNQMKADLGLARGDIPGTSFIIPLPDDAITEDSIVTSVINEFFFAISRGHLTVEVGDIVLSATTIEAHAKAIGDRCRLTRGYREFLTSASGLVAKTPTAQAKLGWNNSTKLDDTHFNAGQAERAREDFDNGKAVVVEMPVFVREKGREAVPSVFQVVLQQSTDDETQELFVRQDLAIDSEKRLATFRSATPVMALTYIDHPSLSDLLVCAEEPTHRSWNAKRPKVLTKYSSPDRVLHAVRNAALRILVMISPDGKRDDTALSIFFADLTTPRPSTHGNSGSGTAHKRPSKEEINAIPPPKPKPITVLTKGRGFAVAVNPNFDKTFHALDCVIEVAYATSSGDSYKQWDPADFWLPDEEIFKSGGVDVGPLRRTGNTLEFRLLSSDSKFFFTGFDTERQLDLRVRYKEVADGADI